MKKTLSTLLIIVLFFGCSKEPKVLFDDTPRTYLKASSYSELSAFNQENYETVLKLFRENCATKAAERLYGDLCHKSSFAEDAKEFIKEYFIPYKIYSEDLKDEGLLTGYYEAELRASLTKSELYRYPLYETPKDLIVVDLSSIYPDLKQYRLRGRLEGNRVIPYDTRKSSQEREVNATVICYCDSKIDKFFLEIQGSGRVQLDTNETFFIGYANQNGHRYRAIGRYLVEIGAIKLEDVSLQSIKAWLEAHPSRIDEVLNYNDSLVYFRKKEHSATGALGLELTPWRSVAVDSRYIPLGSMLYMETVIDSKELQHIVFAQDRGGAIRGAVRADYFLGAGSKAMEVAGRLKSPLKLWIFLPKDKTMRKR